MGALIKYRERLKTRDQVKVTVWISSSLSDTGESSKTHHRNIFFEINSEIKDET